MLFLEKLKFWKKKKSKKETKKEKLKKKTLSRLSRTKFSKKCFEKFNLLVNEFIKEFFSIKDEFTHSELIQIITKKNIKKELKNRITIFTQTLDCYKFDPSGESREKFKLLKEGFKHIVNELK